MKLRKESLIKMFARGKRRKMGVKEEIKLGKKENYGRKYGKTSD